MVLLEDVQMGLGLGSLRAEEQLLRMTSHETSPSRLGAVRVLAGGCFQLALRIMTRQDQHLALHLEGT